MTAISVIIVYGLHETSGSVSDSQISETVIASVSGPYLITPACRWAHSRISQLIRSTGTGKVFSGDINCMCSSLVKEGRLCLHVTEDGTLALALNGGVSLQRIVVDYIGVFVAQAFEHSKHLFQQKGTGVIGLDLLHALKGVESGHRISATRVGFEVPTRTHREPETLWRNSRFLPFIGLWPAQ